MTAPLRAVAIVPARAGSKGLPGKNVRPLMGRPLAAWTLEAARNAARIARTVVTTDDPLVARIAREHGAMVVARPQALAGDDASIVETTLHAADAAGLRDDDVIALLQPTSPLRSAEDVDAAVALFEAAGATGSVMSVRDAETHPLKALLMDEAGLIAPVGGRPETLSAARQSLPRAFHQNGAVYVLTVGALARERAFFAPPCRPYRMPPERSVDIDGIEDFKRCEALLAAACGG